MKQNGLCLLLCLMITCQVNGQNNNQPAGIDPPQQRVVPRFTSDLGYILSAPARLDEQSALWLAGVMAAATGVALTVDTPVYRYFNDELALAEDTVELLAEPGKFYDRIGPDLFLVSTSGLMISSGYLFKDNKLAKTGWTALEAVIFTKLVTSMIKTGMGRMRPFMGEGNLEFEPVQLEPGNPHRSLPSGHTSKMFALAAVISSSYDSPWVVIPVYALAGSSALQRVESNKHWVSDVVVGAVLGYAMGRALAKRNGLIDGKSNVVPVINGGMVGLNIKL